MMSLDIFHFTGDYHGLLVNTNDVAVNPYSHFGQSTMWPRGYPLEYLGQHQPRAYSFAPRKVPVIQQGVVDGDPDIDALFRLTRKPIDKFVNVTFDGGAPSIILPHGSYSPFNSQNTLFLEDALWALVLPVTLADRETDIYRSYWAQKLLELIGHNIVFIPPRTVQVRNPHNFLDDAKLELGIYFHMGRLCEYLRDWSCPPGNRFFQCVLKLTRDMVLKEFIKEKDYQLVDAWIQDLTSFGYKEPMVVRKQPEVDLGESYKVQFYPWEKPTCLPHDSRMSTPVYSTNKETMQKLLKSMCGPYLSAKYTNEQVSVGKFDDALLVVSISGSTEVIPYIEPLYKYHFSRILFCGKEPLSKVPVGITYTRVNGNPSVLTCVGNALRMSYNVKFIAYASDDEYLSLRLLSKQQYGTNLQLSRVLQADKNSNFLQIDSDILTGIQQRMQNTVDAKCDRQVGRPLWYVKDSEYNGFLALLSQCEKSSMTDKCEKAFVSSQCSKTSKDIDLTNINGEKLSINVKPFAFRDLYSSGSLKKEYCDKLDKMQLS